jgi:hypothetical protein
MTVLSQSTWYLLRTDTLRHLHPNGLLRSSYLFGGSWSRPVFTTLPCRVSRIMLLSGILILSYPETWLLYNKKHFQKLCEPHQKLLALFFKLLFGFSINLCEKLQQYKRISFSLCKPLVWNRYLYLLLLRWHSSS